MNCQHFNSKGRGRTYRSSHGVRYVMQFQIEKYLCTGLSDSADNVRTGSGKKLQTNFEARDMLTKMVYQVECFFLTRDVKRDDDLVTCVCHLTAASTCHVERSRDISYCRRYSF